MRVGAFDLMMPNVTIFAALLAGMLSFLSPCVLPLVPPYLVYLTGASIERLADKETQRHARRDVLSASALFVLGFSTVFVALGAAASLIGRVQLSLLAGIDAFKKVTGLPVPDFNPLAALAGLAIILMGLHFLGVFQIPLLMRQKRLNIGKPVGLWGAYVMGFAFAFGWTPCITPVLTAILSIAAVQSTVAKSAALLAVYSLGLGVPFILAAVAVEPFAAFLARFRAHLGLVEKTMGLLLVATGIIFMTPYMGLASAWLLDTFPVLAKIG
jgi:cytochrome c-type biogenesis protein